MNTQTILAPGMRVLIRDEEWIIRRTDVSSDNGYQITCDGLSELIREKTGIFLTQLEDNIQILDPAETELVDDTSPGYQNSLLYMESLLRQQTTNDANIHVAHKGAMDRVPYQLDPALQALEQPRQRILIADAVGLGKTLEAGILVSELIQRGRGKRILVLTLKSMLTQFQKEFWNRFTIPLTRLDSIGLQRVRHRIPTNHNPFYYYDKSIISIDTLKQDGEYRVYLEQAYWDIIIIDEVHNVAERGTRSQRARLARLLSSRSDTLIMLSATPHDGRARSFASLMNMLDPTAISDPEHYAKEDFSSKGLVIRRFKKDIQNQVETEFKERSIEILRHAAGIEEEAAYDQLLEIPFTSLQKKGGKYDANRKGDLLRVTFQKALFSSPAACIKSVQERIKKLQKQAETDPANVSNDIKEEISHLQYLQKQLALITPERYSKYQQLIKRLKDKKFNWSSKTKDDRLVIFSERIETLKFLQQQLQADLKLKDRQLTLLHGGMSDIEQQSIVEDFGKPGSPLRLLLCSDVASEGINLHYQAHRLIHFDIPWSLMVFQQRNGRIDRYGQEKEPQIYYLITESQNKTIRGDTRILEVLQQKDDQAYKNIGDPSAFMHVFDVREEEQLTQQAMASGKSAAAFDRQYQPEHNEGDDLLSLFLGDAPAIDNEPKTQQHTTSAQYDKQEHSTQPERIEPGLSLYPSDYDYCKQALKQISGSNNRLQYSADDKTRQISLVAPDDLRYRFKLLPREIKPDNWQFMLSSNKETMMQEIARSRQDENAWPKIHYLWPQHPVVDWLQDRTLTCFGRHTAPVIVTKNGLQTGETVFIISGLIPNRKSHPLVHEWFGICFIHGKYHSIKPFKEILQQTQLGHKPIPNPGSEINKTPIIALLPQAIAHASEWMTNKRNAFEDHINKQLNAQLEELDRLRAGQHQQLALQLDTSKQLEAVKQSKKEQRTLEINKIFDDYIQWVEDTMTTESQAYLQVISVLTRPY
jgi:superfamily II DNA or RNA helicase